MGMPAECGRWSCWNPYLKWSWLMEMHRSQHGSLKQRIQIPMSYILTSSHIRLYNSHDFRSVVTILQMISALKYGYIENRFMIECICMSILDTECLSLSIFYGYTLHQLHRKHYQTKWILLVRIIEIYRLQYPRSASALSSECECCF